MKVSENPAAAGFFYGAGSQSTTALKG